MSHVIAVIFLVAGALFILIGATVGAHLPLGQAPFHFLGAICLAICGIAWWHRPISDDQLPPEIPPPPDGLNWFQRKRYELFHFDVGRLNLYGWALLLTSMGICVLCSLAVAQFLQLRGNGFAGRAIGIVVFILAVLWFQAGKRLFDWAGVSIYRRHRERTPIDDP